MEPALNAVVSHGNFPETLMRECSPGIEETFLHCETSFRSIPYRLRKIFDHLFFFILRAKTKLRRGLYRYVLKRVIQCYRNKTLTFLKILILL